jgi:hypothetical protein
LKYQLIYADAPWTYLDKAHAGQRGAIHKYSLMTVRQLCGLKVADIADNRLTGALPPNCAQVRVR